MKFVISSRAAFKYYQQRRKYINDDGEEYRYLVDPGQVRGLREMNIVLFDGFEKKQEILDFLLHYRGYNEIFYELGSVM